MFDFKYLTTYVDTKLLVLIVFVAFLIKNIVKNRPHPRIVKFSKTLPGPFALPIIGNSVNIAWESREGIGKYFMRCLKSYGPAFRLWIGNHFVVVLSNIEDIQVVLSSSKTLGRPDIFLSFSSFLGYNLSFSKTVPDWKKQRKALDPFFMKNNVVFRIPQMTEVDNQLVARMKKKVNGPEFDVSEELGNASFDNFTKIFFDFILSDQDKEELQFQERVKKGAMICFWKMFCSWLHFDFIWNHLYQNSLDESRRKIFGVLDKNICFDQEQAKKHADNLSDTEKIHSENFSHSMIQTIQKLKIEMKDDDLAYNEILMFLVAGTETQSVAMGSCLLALANHPDIQETLYREIHQVLGDDDRNLEKSDLSRLSYVDQVINESLRFFGLPSYISRKCDDDLKIGTTVYPAGTNFILNTSGVNYNPNFYQHPYQFNPENFAPETAINRPSYLFLAFSRGPRNCIGKSYAELGMKLRLIALVRAFTFHTTTKLENIILKPGIIESSSIGYPISIKLRKKSSKQSCVRS